MQRTEEGRRGAEEGQEAAPYQGEPFGRGGTNGARRDVLIPIT